MIGLRYADELFAIYRIPREFWILIREDLRYDGQLRRLEGAVLFLSLPILFAYLIFNLNITFGTGFYSLLIASATLFVGFSMNSVLLLLKYSSKEDASPLLVDQTRNMIAYLLYLGVFLAFIGVAGYTATIQLTDTMTETNIIYLANSGISATSVFILTHFLIVVLFLPARIFTIIENSYDESYT